MVVDGIPADTTDLVIVGIDPGTTAAVAVLNLDGDLVHHKSGKEFSKNDIIQEIVRQGRPVIVGTDVSPAPSQVAAIASNLGADLSVPDEDLQADYKEDLVAGFDLPRADAHTEDAVAAAEYARRTHKDTIEQVLRRVDDADLDRKDAESVVLDVMTGSTAIGDAIAAATDDGDEQADAQPEQAGADRDWERIAEKRQQRISRLEDKVDNLEAYTEQLEDAQADRQDAAADMDAAVTERNREINRLRRELEEKAARVQQLASENERLRTAIDRLTDDGYQYIPAVDDLASAGTDIVYCDTYSGDAVSDVIDIVVAEESVTGTARYQELAERGVTVVALSALDDPVELADGYVIELSAVQDAADGEGFMEWLDDYRKRQQMS